jgi:hypothetical protein
VALSDDLLAVLDDPTHMWTHALKELSNEAQRLFLTLTLLPKPVSSDVLQIAYTAQVLNRSESFLDSLKSLEDSFISIEKPYGDLRRVSFRNPSLQDFAIAHLNANSDWLDMLLSSPKYFEQVVNVFSLAMSSPVVLINPQTRSRRPGAPRHSGIKTWVARQAKGLIGTAVNLLEAEGSETSRDNRKLRLGQLLEIMAIYGIPTDNAVLKGLKKATAIAMRPDGRESANAMLTLLETPSYRRLLDDFLGDEAAAVMRTNVLDKDDWKFAVLARLDRLLKCAWEDSWESWGGDYVHYARQLAEELSDSTNDEELRKAISEMEEINSMLDADLYEEINTLEERRSRLPRDEDYDDNSSGEARIGQIDEADTRQLDRIFSTLL